MAINADKYRLRGPPWKQYRMLNIHNPLTVLLDWVKLSSDQQINFSYAVQNTRRLAEVTTLHFFITVTIQNTLISCKSDFWSHSTRHTGYLNVQHSKQWMVTLYAQASNTLITSQAYQKWSGGVILGNNRRYCSVYELQDKTEYRLKKATLISSLSHFNLGI